MPRKYTDQELLQAIATSVSWSEVGRKLGTASAGKHGRYVADKLGANYDHFLGRSWNKGNRKAQDLEALCSSKTTRSSLLKETLFEKGLKERRCEECDADKWMGKPIPLELEHIDGDKTNNALENLKVLCCNCHALTPTWRRGWKNKQAPVAQR